jgi:hypothetical protein
MSFRHAGAGIKKAKVAHSIALENSDGLMVEYAPATGEIRVTYPVRSYLSELPVRVFSCAICSGSIHSVLTHFYWFVYVIL